MSEERRNEMLSQVRRLAGLDRYPHEIEGVTELVDVLDDVTSTDDQAQTIIDGFLDTPQRCPLPADIRIAARQLRQASGAPEPGSHPQQCPRCKGSGWIVKQVGEYEGAEKCNATA